MKKFSFTLDRVLDWRRLQVRMEEIRLEQMNLQRRTLEIQRAELVAEFVRIQNSILDAPGVTGGELETWDSFRQFADAEGKRIECTIASAQEQADRQIQVVAAKRREVQLLEKLKDRRKEVWLQELDKETQQLAEETYLARWKK